MKKLNVSIIIITIILTLVLGINSVNAVSSKKTNITNESVQTNELSKEEAKEERANKNLSSLEVEGYNLNPYFNKNNPIYTVIIPKDVTSIDINAEPEAAGAIVRISGNTKLTKNENTVSIRVTAEDGTSKVYTINVLKEPEVSLKLNSLEIEGIDLNPVFNSDIFYYESSLEDNELTSFNVSALSNDNDANIEILGADNIVDGENLINIIVSNDEEKTVYQVKLDVDMLGEKEKQKENVITRLRKIINYSLWGFAGFLLFIVFILVIVLIRKIVKIKRNKHHNDKNK